MRRLLKMPISKLKNRLFAGPAGQVFKGMATLAVGTLAARAVAIASTPVLTRLYAPEDFGVLSVFTALVALLLPLINFRYVMAVPLPRSDRVAMNLMVLSAGLTLGMAGVTGGLLWGAGPPLLGLLSMDVLVPWWWLIAMALIGSGFYEILTMWATRRRAYTAISRTQVTQSVFGAVVKVTLGFIALKPFGLLLGQIATQSGGITTLSRQFWGELSDNARFVSWRRLRQVAILYRGFPIYRLPSQFMLVFATQAPLIFTAMLFDAGTTGQLGMALTFLALPLDILGRTTSRAYVAELATLRLKDPASVHKVSFTVLRRLILLAIVPTLFLFFFSPSFFPVLLGHEWDQAGHIASILSIYLFMQFCTSTQMHIYSVYNRNDILLLMHFGRSLLISAVFFAAYYVDQNYAFVITVYAIANAVSYLVILLITLNFSKQVSVKVNNVPV